MDQQNAGRRRRTFRWPKEARELVRIHLNAQRAHQRGQNSDDDLRALVTKLVEVSRNPRRLLAFCASVRNCGGHTANGHSEGNRSF